MTKTSTALPSVASAELTSWEPPEDEEAKRGCSITGQVTAFLVSDAAQRPDWGTLRPARQLALMLNALVTGVHLAVMGAMETPPPFRKLRPVRSDGPNVWELRTTDVRLFGWILPTSKTFIGINAILKKDLLLSDGTEDDKAYNDQIAMVVDWRRRHGVTHLVWKLSQNDISHHFKC